MFISRNAFIIYRRLLLSYFIFVRCMNKGYDRKYCEQFQVSLTSDKIDRIWKSFREAGNSMQGRIIRANFKKVMTGKYNIKNERFLDKLFDRFKLQKFTQIKADREQFIDLQDFVIGLAVISLIQFKKKVEIIFRLTDLDEDECLSLQQIENMIERIQKIFCKENASAKVESFSLLIDNAHKKAQRTFKQVLFLLYKNSSTLKNEEGDLITIQQYMETMETSKDLFDDQKFLPLNLSLAEVIQNIPSELQIRISQTNKGQFCKFRKELYTILEKTSDQKDVIKYPWKVEIVKGQKVLQVLPNVQKVGQKDKKQEKASGKAKNPRTQFKQIYEQKAADQTLQSYQLKVKKMKETKQDPRLNIKFDKIVKK